MDSGQYEKYRGKIERLAKKRGNCKTVYKRQSSLWQDFDTAGVDNRIFRYNKRVTKKKKKIEDKIVSLLETMKNEGVDTQKIIEDCGLSDINGEE